MNLAARIFYGVVIVGAAGLGSCSNNQPEPESNTPEPVTTVNAPASGKQIFEERCIACHGADGTAGIGGAANLKTLQADSITVTQTIKQGKNAMPAFDKALTENELGAVTAYVKALHQ